MTAGEAVKEARKRGIKCTVKELVSAYREIEGCDPEWRILCRLFFFTKDEFERLIELLPTLDKIRGEKEMRETIERNRLMNTPVMGFCWFWENDDNGLYGRKRTFKVLAPYKGNEYCKPANFTSCNEEQYQKVEDAAGKKYFGKNVPTLIEFTI